jgi:hypothetical protein
MGIIMTLYDVTLSYFSHRVSEVFAQVFIIPLDFFHWIFGRLYSFFTTFKYSVGSVTIQNHVTT